jgi:hypothetical protein
MNRVKAAPKANNRLIAPSVAPETFGRPSGKTHLQNRRKLKKQEPIFAR